ncbi:hypothetical protein T439DRAFT_330537 [Meredithblackwellia eburnea MCA 4105]
MANARGFSKQDNSNSDKHMRMGNPSPDSTGSQEGSLDEKAPASTPASLSPPTPSLRRKISQKLTEFLCATAEEEGEGYYNQAHWAAQNTREVAEHHPGIFIASTSGPAEGSGVAKTAPTPWSEVDRYHPLPPSQRKNKGISWVNYNRKSRKSRKSQRPVSNIGSLVSSTSTSGVSRPSMLLFLAQEEARKQDFTRASFMGLGNVPRRAPLPGEAVMAHPNAPPARLGTPQTQERERRKVAFEQGLQALEGRRGNAGARSSDASSTFGLAPALGARSRSSVASSAGNSEYTMMQW